MKLDDLIPDPQYRVSYSRVVTLLDHDGQVNRSKNESALNQ